MSIILKLPIEIQLEVAKRAKSKRLALNFSQEGLSSRAGVSLGTLKRFEKSGKISLDALLKLALVLEALTDFDAIFQPATTIKSLDTLMHEEKQRRRGRKK